MKYNSTKSNVMVFCCNLLKDIPFPNFTLNGVPIDKVSNCKYLGHCINDKLIDDDDMARQRRQIYAQGNALVRKFYWNGPHINVEAVPFAFCTAHLCLATSMHVLYQCVMDRDFVYICGPIFNYLWDLLYYV